MPNDARAPDSRRTSRRTLLRLVGGLAAGAGVATTAGAESDQSAYTLSQGDRTVAVEPLSGETSVERLYDYRLPDRYDGHGDTTADSGPNYGSVGTTDLQRESTTVTFLYDGPNGLSLVVVHDAGDDPEAADSGGAVSWDLVVRPVDAEWLVKDDLYVDPDTGDRAATNFDNWETNGRAHAVDWTWAGGATDGGVLGYLNDRFAVRIDPSYNEAAALWDRAYSGEVDDWQFLSGDTERLERVSLSLDEPVTITGPSADPGSDELPETPNSGEQAGDGTGADDEDDEEDDRSEDDDEDGRDDVGDEEDEADEDEDDEDERDEEDDEEDDDGDDEDDEDDDRPGRGPDGDGPPGLTGGGPPGEDGGGPPFGE